MCGGSAPAPPPDYTNEKRTIRKNTEARYQSQADKYNNAVGQYNQQLSSLAGDANSLSSRVSGLDYANLDDRTFSNLNQKKNRLENDFYSTNFNQSKPDFRSSFGSEYGEVGVTNIPSLTNKDMNTRSRLQNTLSEIDNELSSLRNERDSEQQRINNVKTDVSGQLASLAPRINSLDIGDESQAAQIRGDLRNLKEQRRSFSSPLLDQGAFSRFDNEYDSLMGSLDNLSSEREAEQQRIQNRRNELRGFSDQVYNQLGDLSISDKDQIEALQQDIASRERNLSRFDSPLSADFSGVSNELSDSNRQLDALLSERQAEQDRIAQAEQDYLNKARALSRQADSGNFRSASGINAIEDQISRLQGNVEGFQSPIESDFSNVNPLLSDAQSAVQNLRSRRQDALGEISSAIPEATQGLSDIELSNEDAIRQRRADLQDIDSRLSRFSGGEVDQIQSQITDGLSQVDARLQELNEYRSQVEQNAQDILSRVQSSDYYSTDDLSGDQSSLESARAEAELYDAQQAMDEIDAAMNELNSERQRLEQDAEAVSARQRKIRESLEGSLGQAGLPAFENFAQTDPLSSNEYAQRFNLSDEEQEELGRISNNSAFARALGVIKAG